MAKGSVRKKGKKWYYRFYVEDASGNLVQKEYAGTESKSETEKLLRQAMDDYESKKFIAKSENITIGELLDIWAEEELKTGTLSNGTVQNYLGAITNIKKHPISERKLKNVTSEHLQAFFNLLSFGGTYPDGSERKGYSKDYIRSFSAVLQQSFRFAVSPKQYITFNPMQYIKLKKQAEDVDLFSDDEVEEGIQPISHEDYERLIEYLKVKNPPAILPIQIAYYAGLRIGEVCGLTWQDINLEEQYLTVRRSMRYNGARHKTEIGATKRKKIRTVDFCDTLAAILKTAKAEQHKNRFRYGELYSQELVKNFQKEIRRWNPDVIIPVPLHRARRRKRGYNQAQILAENLGKMLCIPVDSKSLARRKKTSPQKKLGHNERKKNLKNAFAVTSAFRPVRKVLLVDDIYTTGNTLDAAAKALKEKGVEKVYFLTISIGQGY